MCIEERMWKLAEEFAELQAENKQLKEKLEEYYNAEKFMVDPPHDQICCGCVPLLKLKNKRLLKTLDSIAVHTLHLLWILDSETYSDLKVFFNASPRGLQ